MKRKPTRLIAAFVSLGLVAVLTLGMAACSGSATTKSTATLVSISVTPYSPANLAVGSTQRFVATGEAIGHLPLLPYFVHYVWCVCVCDVSCRVM